MGNFLDIYGLKCLVHNKTCFKSVINPSCIDLFLTNSSNSFQNVQYHQAYPIVTKWY